MKKEIIVTVPQGMGDIFWVYQKVKPFCEKISFRIAVVKGSGAISDIQKRSETIVNHFPGVHKVTLEEMGPAKYSQVIKEKHNLADLLDKHGDVIEFCYNANTYLDEGVRLEDIDVLPVLRNIQLPVDDSLALPKKYTLLYVSGSTSKRSQVGSLKYLWAVEQWADIAVFMSNKSNLPLYLLGAEFDRPTLEELHKCLASRGVDVGLIVSPAAPQLFSVLKNAKAFVGYQSGLNILADNFDVPQVIVYFPHMNKMQDTWAKPENRNKLFKYCRFDEGTDVAKKLISTIL